MKHTQLPALLITLSLSLPALSAQAPRVLFVVTAATQIELRDGRQHPTGYFLDELTEPATELKRRGVQIDYASPNGAAPTIDPSSINGLLYFMPFPWRLKEAINFANNEMGLQNPLRLEELSEGTLEQYAGVFVPGGHGAWTDLANDPHVARILRHFHSRQAPTGLICHGTAAMLATANAETFLYSGYHMTAFSKAEEKLAEVTTLGGAAAMYVDDELAQRGAIIQNHFLPWDLVNVVVDRELITGQNPYSAQAMSKVFADAILSAEHR